ncbi:MULTISPECIES: DUF3727 domain-containing protein [unclassified Roseofilum]|uniref:DUF3727 domain-containing protein n=1 Tax=unclassified Roseofilum TaxID=2620099 RepID=UPI000E84E0D6|nr:MULTISPECIES: DUF3727 domain-containing protein [unclassified Roseofilum]MBP0007260.1 DUF3727 domain-containing protein [Roseofilum sp. Belize Diploria]MBP0031654.1 DUF3727 domain-containing protein [Roseofilum sp. Belize BBD 4]HBR00640.1 DUF3727 domain-containing protein [Cyanobacteria bacterium UBA11691]
MAQEAMENDPLTVFLTDSGGQELECTIEYSFTHENENYFVLLPKDTPVEIFVWQTSGEEEDLVPVEDPSMIDELFNLAKAVLSEQNLQLKRTGITLTVEGDIPDLEEEDDEDIDGDLESFQLLASFYFGEDEYEISTPLDPLFLLGKMADHGKATELSESELKKIEHLLPEIEQTLEEELLA